MHHCMLHRIRDDSEESGEVNLTPAATALLVIDVQKAFEEIEASGARRDNPGAEARIGDLLAAFRATGAPLFHIRHASREKESRFRRELPGYEPRDFARERPGEPIIVKHVNSAFIGTELEQRLRRRNIETVVICGATTNHCVETTARMSGNLGFRTLLACDACWTFDRIGIDGTFFKAQDIAQMTFANLSGEFAEIVRSAVVIDALQARREA
jgi:nicotinamidase-related amidase